MSSSVVQDGVKAWSYPEWHGPHGDCDLKVANSLTGTKTPFVPASGTKKVTWYICGPTVYDSSHVGHARAYLTFDLIRRILEDYFAYDVHFVMNITDVDDKIIKRARVNYLIDQYISSVVSPATALEDISKAFSGAMEKQQAKIETLEGQVESLEGKAKQELLVEIEGEKLKLKVIQKEQAEVLEKKDSSNVAEIVGAGKSVLGNYLDQLKGSSISDHSIFQAHCRRFESEFLEDLSALGIRYPDILTRVSEYIPKIISFIETIISNGYGYESNGSVYFDVTTFSKNQDYGKLAPWCVGNVRRALEGEGSLSSSSTSEKRSPSDFALWKKSKAGEPRWESPWGEGRPGWHIECSAMASDIIGDNIDIHSGGEDLKFPHHDNELAQSEAYSGQKQWVNHFWHAGHLNIDGLKMSKSLKNFITIRQAMQVHTGRQIRILFLLQGWDCKMNYGDDSLAEAAAKEKTLDNFFQSIKAFKRERGQSGGLSSRTQFWSAADRKMNKTLETAQAEVHVQLCDNFNYPGAMHTIFALVSTTNKYYRSNEDCKVLLLDRVVKYVDKMMRVFGVISDTEAGFTSASVDSNTAETVSKFLNAFSSFRDEVREACFAKLDSKEVLALCDVVRDHVLPELGVRLEDRGGGKSSIWKLGDPKTLIAEREEKQKLALEKKVSKIKNKIKIRRKDLLKWENASKPPSEMLKDGYSQWDDKGFPTHSTEGKKLSNKAIKNLNKKFQAAKKQTEKLSKMLEKDPDFITTLQAEVETMEKELKEMKC